MSRWSYSNKTEADYLKKIEIWWLKKYGYLDGWKSGTIEWNNRWADRKDSVGIEVSTMYDSNFIRFNYSQTGEDGEKENFDYTAELVSTECNYGGKRWWFICPLVKEGKPCKRRVGVLYKNGKYFGCRHCYDLTYRSKNENRRYKFYHLFRVLETHDRVDKIREKMKRSFYAGNPTKKFKQIMRIHGNNKQYYEKLRNEAKNV